MVHKMPIANKFQLYHKIKWNIIYYISPHVKYPQSISPTFLIFFFEIMNRWTLQQQQDYSIRGNHKNE